MVQRLVHKDTKVVANRLDEGGGPPLQCWGNQHDIHLSLVPSMLLRKDWFPVLHTVGSSRRTQQEEVIQVVQEGGSIVVFQDPMEGTGKVVEDTWGRTW